MDVGNSSATVCIVRLRALIKGGYCSPWLAGRDLILKEHSTPVGKKEEQERGTSKQAKQKSRSFSERPRVNLEREEKEQVALGNDSERWI